MAVPLAAGDRHCSEPEPPDSLCNRINLLLPCLVIHYDEHKCLRYELMSIRKVQVDTDEVSELHTAFVSIRRFRMGTK